MTKRIDSFQRIAFTLPAILFIGVFMDYPILQAIGLSFTDFDGIHSIKWTGLANYVELFTSKEFGRVALNNLYLAVLGIPLSVAVPLIISLLLFERVRGHKLFKVAYLIPSALSVIIVGMLFRVFFSYDGPIHRILNAVFPSLTEVDFWETGLTSIPIIVSAMVWAGFGVNSVIFLSGMSLISESIYESCDLDGFTWLQKHWYITLPLIINILEFVTVMSIISIFSSMFGYIYSITGGGPGYESTVLEYLIFIKGFRMNNLAYASAASTVLFVALTLMSWLLMRFFAKRGEWQ